MSRPRILLHAMTFKRDLGAFYVLSKLLSHLECDCFVANNDNALARYMRIWQPHAIVTSTMSWAKSFKRVFPGSLIFLFSGEGGGSKDYSDEPNIVKDPETLGMIRHAFLWGNAIKGYIQDAIDELGEKCPLHKNSDLFDHHFTVAGHPRLDLIRFAARHSDSGSKTRIGFVGAFNFLNLKRTDQTLLRVILDQPKSKMAYRDNMLDEVIFKLRYLNMIIDLIEELGSENYKFSIRPYPLERVDSYPGSWLFREYDVEVDDSVEFFSWASRQDLIIGSTSSTISQLAMAKKPFINLDAVCQRNPELFDMGVMLQCYNKPMEKHRVRDWKTLLRAVKNYNDYKLESPELTDQLDHLYNVKTTESVLMLAAKKIKRIIDAEKPEKSTLLPTSFLPSIDNFYLNMNAKLHPGAYDKSYSFFNYAQIREKLDRELSGVVENILKDERND